MKIAAGRFAVAVVLSLASMSAASAQTGMSGEQVQRRHQVRVMEGVLTGAAQLGAQLLAVKVQQIDPSIVLLSGSAPRAVGLVLEGQGVLFYIEVPGINPFAIYTMRSRSRDQGAERAILALRRFVLQKADNAQDRVDLEQYFRYIEQRLLPPGATSQAARQANMGGVANVMAVGAAPPATFAPAPTMDDPEAEYERLVTEQLMNAMLDYSHQLGLGLDEWLTIAARASQGPLENPYDVLVTLTLRIKGSDLAEFRAGRLTREQAMARIVKGEF
jgi:hypothetical protein